MTLAPSTRRVRTAGPGRIRRLVAGLRSSDLLLKITAGLLVVMILASALAELTGFAGSTSKTVGARFEPPSVEFWLGTDNLGRSVLPRLLEGVWTTFLLSLIAVVCSAVISTCLGLLAGYFTGAANEAVMRLIDVVYAFPALVLALLVSAVVGPGRVAALVSIVFITIPLMTRMVRIATLQVARRDFVISARISGLRTSTIFLRHLVPNVAGTIAVQASYALSIAMLVEGGLSFLGFGVQVPDASLGLLIQNGMLYLTKAPWLILAPGIVLVLVILCVNIVGDSLRDTFEPRETRSLS